MVPAGTNVHLYEDQLTSYLDHSTTKATVEDHISTRGMQNYLLLTCNKETCSFNVVVLTYFFLESGLLMYVMMVKYKHEISYLL